MKYNPTSKTKARVFDRVTNEMNGPLKRHNRYDVDGVSVVSDATQIERSQVLRQMLNDLFCLGYLLQKLSNFGEGHVRAVVRSWEKQGLSASTLMQAGTI